MHIEKLSLINFKNYGEATLNFSPAINCIVGINGSGKTNLLDAIYYLSSTKSYFNAIDSQNIKFDEQFYSIKGVIDNHDEQFDIRCVLKEGVKKNFKVNGIEYDKLREHVGRFPSIFITPYDTDLIREGSELRRKFFDQIISQIDREYLDALITYNHYLKQRNSLLKQFAERKIKDKILVERYDNMMITTGELINSKRKRFAGHFRDSFFGQMANITDAPEATDLYYQSDFNKAGFAERFKANLEKDILMQRTTYGIHKDDYKFMIKEAPLKKFGSQGQQKSFVIALKLAHFFTLKNTMKIKPILLLDDVFDKLDSNRIERLIEMMSNGNFGQVFITDARSERTKELLNSKGIPARFYEISEGKVLEMYEE